MNTLEEKMNFVKEYFDILNIRFYKDGVTLEVGIMRFYNVRTETDRKRTVKSLDANMILTKQWFETLGEALDCLIEYINK